MDFDRARMIGCYCSLTSLGFSRNVGCSLDFCDVGGLERKLFGIQRLSSLRVGAVTMIEGQLKARGSAAGSLSRGTLGQIQP